MPAPAGVGKIVRFGHFAELTTGLELEQFIALENSSGLSDEQQRALSPLAGAPHGRTLAIMLAHGFPDAMLDKLVSDRLATKIAHGRNFG
jgi:hypothetical protein